MRAVFAVALAACAAAPAAAQNFGSPLWNSPKGGTGITISGDYARPNADLGKGNVLGARATLGLANLSVTAGVTTWKPSGAPQSFTSVGGNAAFRLIGGSLIPLSVNLPVGAAKENSAESTPSMTRLTARAGVSVTVPHPGIGLPP